MLGKIEGRRKRGWLRMRWLDGIIVSWTWVWASSGRWWRTGKPGVLQSMGSQGQTGLSDWTTTTHRYDVVGLRLDPICLVFTLHCTSNSAAGRKGDGGCAELLSLSGERSTEWRQRLPRWLSGKESACNTGDTGSIPGSGRFPWRRKWQSTPVWISKSILPVKSHGQCSLAGDNPWGWKEPRTAERLGAHTWVKTELSILPVFGQYPLGAVCPAHNRPQFDRLLTWVFFFSPTFCFISPLPLEPQCLKFWYGDNISPASHSDPEN